MFKLILLALLISTHASSDANWGDKAANKSSVNVGDKFGVVCKDINGQTRVHARVELPANLFYYAGTRLVPNWLNREGFEPEEFAKQIKVSSRLYKVAYAQLLEERINANNSTEVSGYTVALWLFPDAEKRQVPVVVYLRELLAVADSQDGKVIVGNIIVGSPDTDRLSVVWGEVLNIPTQRHDMVLCRLVK